METWKSIMGYEGIYEVSDQGNVRSKRRKGAPGGLLRPVSRPDGRLRVALSKQGKVTDFLIHRLVLAAFVGPCPEGMEGCHWDDDPKNNALPNLRWDTHAQNVIDKRRNGKMAGNRNYETCGTGRHEWTDKNIIVSTNGTRTCKECKKLSSVRYRTQGVPPGDPLHGTAIGGKRGCKCDPCVNAVREYQRKTEANRARRKNGS